MCQIRIFLVVIVVGLFVAGFAYSLSGRSLLPSKDPRLAESLAFENV